VVPAQLTRTLTGPGGGTLAVTYNIDTGQFGMEER
jgi:hypothetical protein